MITIPQRNLIANFLFGKKGDPALFSPDNFYIGLSSNELTDDGIISGELTCAGYKRAVLENTKSSFSEAVEGLVENSGKAVCFATSEETWTGIKSVFISPNPEPTAGEYAMYVTKVDIPEVAAGVNLYYDTKTLQLSIEAGE